MELRMEQNNRTTKRSGVKQRSVVSTYRKGGAR